MANREKALTLLTDTIERIPGRKADARLIAETLFAIYMATMLEWLIREELSADWLLDNMRARLQLALGGMA
jgi:hypothetical protein